MPPAELADLGVDMDGTVSLMTTQCAEFLGVLVGAWAIYKVLTISMRWVNDYLWERSANKPDNYDRS